MQGANAVRGSRIVSVVCGCCAVLPTSSLSWADESTAAESEGASNIILDRAGPTSGGRNLPSFASGAQAKFTSPRPSANGLALATEDGSQAATQRPFVLFAAASASLIRGACEAATRRWPLTTPEDAREALDVLRVGNMTGGGCPGWSKNVQSNTTAVKNRRSQKPS